MWIKGGHLPHRYVPDFLFLAFMSTVAKNYAQVCYKMTNPTGHIFLSNVIEVLIRINR